MFQFRRSKSPEAASPIVAHDRLTGTVSQQVDVSLEALREFGLLEDADETRQLLTDQYLELRASGFHGELYPQIPLSPSQVSFQGLLDALDSRRSPLAPPSLIGHQVWSSGYNHDELSALGGVEDGSIPVHGRLAVADLSGMGSDEPLLHFRGHPFDGKASRVVLLTNPRTPSEEITLSVPTQQQMLARAQENVRMMYPGYNLVGLNLPAICAIMLQRRIRGEPLPLQDENYMHIPQLRRLHPLESRDDVGHVASVRVQSGQLQLGLSRDVPRMSPHGGIGLSLGRNLSE